MSSDDIAQLWSFLPWGYLFTIAIETPVLVLGLSRRHSLRDRLIAGVGLTACTYPIVVLVLPVLFGTTSGALYLTVAETFAPVAECLLFWAVWGCREEFNTRTMWRDFAVITLANLCSFGGGELWHWLAGRL